MKVVDLLVLGAGGYVGAEVLRLASGHPGLRLSAAVSRSGAGQRLDAVFPMLPSDFGAARFVATANEHPFSEGPLAVVSALPHGESAAAIANLLVSLPKEVEVFVCDLAADFRHESPTHFTELYGRPHGAPDLASRFHAALPDLDSSLPRDFIAHPGCFTTAVVLGSAPLINSGLVSGRFVASCVTGSTGGGGRPKPGAHHPERHGDLRAYSPLAHRHLPEMRELLGRAAPAAVVPDPAFVPHSGPFARGIHATLVFELLDADRGDAALDLLAAHWEGHPFVGFVPGTPRLKEVVGSNRARIGATRDGDRLVVFSAIDNLIKGAAGGAIQWVNRRFDFPETAGLEAGGVPWI